MYELPLFVLTATCPLSFTPHACCPGDPSGTSIVVNTPVALS
jgi:hypothetical protein